MTNIIEISSLIPMEYANREKFFLNENNEIQPIIVIVKKTLLVNSFRRNRRKNGSWAKSDKKNSCGTKEKN